MTSRRSGPFWKLTHIVYPRAVQREIELWRVVKDTRELRCITRYLPTGMTSVSWKARTSGALNC